MRFEAIEKEKMLCCDGFLREKKKIKERDRVKIEFVLLCLYF
jgi:hypothetical protein